MLSSEKNKDRVIAHIITILKKHMKSLSPKLQEEAQYYIQLYADRPEINDIVMNGLLRVVEKAFQNEIHTFCKRLISNKKPSEFIVYLDMQDEKMDAKKEVHKKYNTDLRNVLRLVYSNSSLIPEPKIEERETLKKLVYLGSMYTEINKEKLALSAEAAFKPNKKFAKWARKYHLNAFLTQALHKAWNTSVNNCIEKIASHANVNVNQDNLNLIESGMIEDLEDTKEELKFLAKFARDILSKHKKSSDSKGTDTDWDKIESGLVIEIGNFNGNYLQTFDAILIMLTKFKSEFKKLGIADDIGNVITQYTNLIANEANDATANEALVNSIRNPNPIFKIKS